MIISVIKQGDMTICKSSDIMLVTEFQRIIWKGELVVKASETPYKIAGAHIKLINLLQMPARNQYIPIIVLFDGISVHVINKAGTQILMLSLIERDMIKASPFK